jgi:hypothetical protein
MRISFSTFISVNAMRFNLIFESTKGAHVFVWFCFFRGFFRVFIVESLCQPVLGRLESHMLAPKF